MTENNKINLWSTALLDASQQSPFEFMREQGEVLKEQTNGLLWGEVKVFSKNEVTYHEFQIASQRLGDYRCLLLRTAHAKHIYPLYIYDYSQSDEALKPYPYVPTNIYRASILPIPTIQETESALGKYFAPPPSYVANDYRQFENQFAEILESSGTRAIVHSLLIQSNSLASV